MTKKTGHRPHQKRPENSGGASLHVSLVPHARTRTRTAFLAGPPPPFLAAARAHVAAAALDRFVPGVHGAGGGAPGDRPLAARPPPAPLPAGPTAHPPARRNRVPHALHKMGAAGGPRRHCGDSVGVWVCGIGKG
jgi:hypothetical protein